MSSPPLNALRAFAAAARLGAIGRAAEELHVTHAAISHQIGKLEEWFGTPLFHRHGRGVRLTEAGRELGPVLDKHLGAITTACDALRGRMSEPRVTLACIPSVATRWLIPRLGDFSRQHPEIRLQMVYAPTPDLLEPSGADLVIRDVTGEPPANVACERLLPGETRPVCSPDWLHRNGPITEPADLAAANLLHDASEEAWLRWLERHDVALAGRRLGGPVFQDFNMMSTAAVAGHGVALCPIALIGDDIRRGDLIQLFDSGADLDRSYCLLYVGALTPAAASFRDWIRARI